MTSRHVIHASIDRPDPALAARFARLKMEVVAELVPLDQLMDSAIKPLALREVRFAGPAVTVTIERANTFMGYAAIGVAKAGDVIVVAAGGDTDAASWGGGLTLSARNIGVAGVVVDGAVIDAPSILAREVPVMCRTSTLRHPPEQVRGSVNVPVRCGGAEVFPGDMIVGDLDGVAVVRRADIDAVLAAAEEKTARLAAIAAELTATGGTLWDRVGGRRFMTDAGVEWID